jgi:hypothetical protein
MASAGVMAITKRSVKLRKKPRIWQAVWKREAPAIRGLFFVGLRRDWS